MLKQNLRGWCYRGLVWDSQRDINSARHATPETHFAGLERKRRRSIAVIDREENRRERCLNPAHQTLRGR
jgi:hypothetical protein